MQYSLMVTAVCMTIAVMSSGSSARNYYVDATNGNDANSGLTSNLAWKSLSKVNGATFSGGDSVLFKKGEVWNGTLQNNSSGNAAGQLVYSSYGSGNKPLINANAFRKLPHDFLTSYSKFPLS